LRRVGEITGAAAAEQNHSTDPGSYSSPDILLVVYGYVLLRTNISLTSHIYNNSMILTAELNLSTL